MMRKFVLCLSTAACSLIGLCGSTVAATKNVDILVTHNSNSPIATYTVKETSGKDQPAGMVYIAGQAFRRGDLPPGTYPVFQDAKSQTPLVQQLDEIATRRENGDDGSIRHLVFSVQLPAIPANGTFTMEIVKRTGNYSATAKQNLAALATSHDLKVHLTDVRNQDGSMRGSGNLTFDINAAALNTGRDAPRPCAVGPVRDCWIVVGPPIDDTTLGPDPLLYVTCYLDLTTDPTDQTSLGPVRHVCRVDNSWMNVAAGSPGNSGSPGVAGYANDPQALSYRPQLLDGSANLLDWSWLDAAVNSLSNSVALAGDAAPTGCGDTTLNSVGNWNIPASAGRRSWYFGMPVFYHTDGTPPAGMTNDRLYFVHTIGLEYSGANFSPDYRNIVHLSSVPFICHAIGQMVNPTDQGSGNQTFSFRVWHSHWQSWYTLDQTGAENWTQEAGRTTSPFYPMFTAAEQLYWEETGLVPPLQMTVTPADPTDHTANLDNNYGPMSPGNMPGGASPGDRASLGLTNEYASQAFLLETPDAWERARIASLVGVNYAWSTVLNEATGHVPVLNDGPPADNHAGSGNPYPVLGSRFAVDILDGSYMDGVTPPLRNIPYNDGSASYTGGIWGQTRGYGNDHQPSFHNMIYQVFGSRHHLDALYFAGNRAIYQNVLGPFVQATDDIKGGVHYYGLHDRCCELRGAFWAYRDKMLPAALGGDSNIERTYFNDMLLENYYYELALGGFIDGDSTDYRSNFTPPMSGMVDDTFMHSYGFQVTYQAYAMMRDPMAVYWMPKWLQTYLTNCSDTVPNSLPSYWCATYQYIPNLGDARKLTAGLDKTANVGRYYASDASEVGQVPTGFAFTAGSGVVEAAQQLSYWKVSNGDKLKLVTNLQDFPYPGPDELRTDIWYEIINVTTHPEDGSVKTLQIVNPDTGKPFESFTKNGQPFSSGYTYLKVRSLTYGIDVSTGWASGYAVYAQPILYGLHALGFSAIDPAIAKMTARGVIEPGPQATKSNWNPNVVVP